MMERVTWRCRGNLSPPLSSSLLSGSWSPCFMLFFVLDMMDKESHHKTGSSDVHPKASLQVQRHTFPPCAGPEWWGNQSWTGTPKLSISCYLYQPFCHSLSFLALSCSGSMLGMTSPHRAIMCKLFLPRNKCFSRQIHSVVL